MIVLPPKLLNYFRCHGKRWISLLSKYLSNTRPSASFLAPGLPLTCLNFEFSSETVNCRTAYAQHLCGLGNVVATRLQGFDESLLLDLPPSITVSPPSLLLVGDPRIGNIQIRGFDEMLARQNKGSSNLIGNFPDISGPPIIFHGL